MSDTNDRLVICMVSSELSNSNLTLTNRIHQPRTNENKMIFPQVEQ